MFPVKDSFRLLAIGFTLAGALWCAGQVLKAFTERAQLEGDLAMEQLRGQLDTLAFDVYRAVSESQLAQLQVKAARVSELEAFYFNVLQMMEDIENGQNRKEIKRWRAGGVPDDVRQLHEQAACENAADCR